MFKKYNSIENTYRAEFIDRIKGHHLWDKTYIVQEKVHGANLSYWTTDGLHFYSAKRTGPIEADESFHNYDLILNAIKPKLKAIWSDLTSVYPNLKQMNVFGELIGGEYPHPEVAPDRTAKLVQKGIYYSPSNHFYAFDILVNGDIYLDVDQANALFEKHGLLHAQTIFKGKLEDCLTHSNDFNSLVPQALGLPTLSPNIIEGVIIKPMQTAHFNNGTRVILKHKNEKWAENKKYHSLIELKDNPSETILELQDAIQGYVTENRLNNVVSKIGTISQKDFGKVLGMFNKDVIEDFLKDYHQITDQLDKKEVKLVTKSFVQEAKKLINLKLKNT